MGLWAFGLRAEAQPSRVTVEWPRVEVEVPPGYARLPASPRADEVIGTWRRTALGSATVMQLVRLEGELPERAMTEEERAYLRRSDPVTFTDRVEHVESLGVSVEMLVGESTQNGVRVVRYAAAVPSRGNALLVTLVTPAGEAAMGRRDVAAVLASARGKRAWLTEREARVVWVRVVSGGAAAVAMLVYGIAAVVWRKRGVPGRQRALAVVAGLWAVCAVAMAWPTGGSLWGPAVQAGLLAAVFGWRAMRRAKATEG